MGFRGYHKFDIVVYDKKIKLWGAKTYEKEFDPGRSIYHLSLQSPGGCIGKD